jgi:hypothetical protein
MISQIVIAVIALVFQGICLGIAPDGAEQIAWSRETGFDYHGAVIDYGFHNVIGGHVRILWLYQRRVFIVIGTTAKPALPYDTWHAECSAYYFTPPALP